MSDSRSPQSVSVATFVQSLYADALPTDRELYHYTSLKGLVDILDSGELWASELRSVNDTAELTRGFDLLAGEAAARSGADPTSDVARQLSDWIEHRSRFGPMIFATAFTEEGNLLSQWRGYCPPGAGVSFGVSFGHVKSCASASLFRLGKCIYDSAPQRELAEKLTDLLLAAAYAEGPNSKLHPTQSYHSTFYRLEEDILHWCALMKHDAFKAEAEWRAVSDAHSDFVKGSGAAIRYRVGQSMIIPYIGFPLRNASQVIPIETIITGPTPHPERATESIQRLVARHMKGLHGPWLSQYCQIPFRSW